ncbi:RDD family protein [Frankia sp. Cppng1_Ct_nod]|uniref:RDD family protein n=1 Tax=Frankia sp. Cppng1_Ct_nod TaxID=2897162 RepID=UPI001F5ED7A9|nr:RDD family protein [Frankia sp. Cppng1_Ct_nod]
MSQFVTGEAVPIDLRIARLGSRSIAGLVDLGLQFIALLLLAWLTFEIVAPDDDALASATYLIVLVLVVVGYPVATETLLKGRTVGKATMGLRVVRDDGGPIRFRHAFVRGLVGAVVERPGALLGVPAVISMLISEKSKRLGDLLAGTVVLQERIPRGNTVPATMPPQLAAWASTLDLSSFGDTLALAVRQFLGRVQDLSPEARDRLGGQLVASVQAVVTPPPPPGTPGGAYLSAVLAERTARAHRRLFGGVPAWLPGPAHNPTWGYQYPGYPPGYPGYPAGRHPAVPPGPQPSWPQPDRTIAQQTQRTQPTDQTQQTQQTDQTQPTDQAEKPPPGPFVPPS